MIINFTPINERLCVIRIKGRFFNYSLIHIHAPTNDSEEEAKDQFYEQLERAYTQPAQVMTWSWWWKTRTQKLAGNRTSANDRQAQPAYEYNGRRLVDFAAGRQMAIKSTYFMHKEIHLQTWHSPVGHTLNQIDHCLIEGRHFSDVIDVMAQRGANIDSDYMLVVIKLRARICRASNTKLQQVRYYDELESYKLARTKERRWEKRQGSSTKRL
jgi:hypothetical protein